MRAVLKEFVRRVAQCHAALVFVERPQLVGELPAPVRAIYEAAGHGSIPMISMRTQLHTEFSHASHYHDRVHLNALGARVFSNEVAVALRSVWLASPHASR